MKLMLYFLPFLAIVAVSFGTRHGDGDGVATTCPDQASQCPSGTTCCRLGSGAYGCCPIPHAVCCADHQHCCPAGTTCDTTHQTCLRSDGSVHSAAHRKTPAQPTQSPTLNAQCPDHKSACPDGATCCKLSSGGYGCCPMASAVCCKDHVHCCPSGSTCDTAHSTCLHSNGTFHSAAQRKTPALQMQTHKCPDKKSACPDGTTCCKLSGPGYGCCPMPSAVCCRDHVHCCPAGTTCDTAHSRCSKKGKSVPWSVKTSAFVVREYKTLPYGRSCGTGNCTTDSTCCAADRSPDTCCPFNDGVCCRNGRYCCPSGQRCVTGEGRCESTGGFRTKWTRTQAPLRSMSLRVSCPDGASCPTQSTCCPIQGSHHFQCCPINKANCCDGYCCATGYTCGATGSRNCVRSSVIRPGQHVGEDFTLF